MLHPPAVNLTTRLRTVGRDRTRWISHNFYRVEFSSFLTWMYNTGIANVRRRIYANWCRLRVDLECRVRAEPRPEVVWYKNDMLLDRETRGGRVMRARGQV